MGCFSGGLRLHEGLEEKSGEGFSAGRSDRSTCFLVSSYLFEGFGF